MCISKTMLALVSVAISLISVETYSAQIINADTTWSSGQTISLNDDLHIPNGITLTIEAGVSVEGNDYQILSQGTLIAQGTHLLQIEIKNANFTFGSDYKAPGRIELDNVEMYGGSFLAPTGLGSYGSFSLSNSHITDVTGFYIWYPTGPSLISKNIFERSSGINVLLSSPGALTISNNVFVEQQGGYAVGVSANYSNTLQVINNSFLSIDRVALDVFSGYTSNSLPAENNYFGTTNIETINAMILDRNDGIDRSHFVTFQPFLSEPHPDTPLFDHTLFNITRPRDFVEQQYRDFLGREGEVTGVDYWSVELEAGRVSRAQVVDLFFSSSEFQNNIAPVARLYFAYFNRIPDYDGLIHWTEVFRQSGSLDAISQAFADSPEFVNTYGALSNAQFVDLVYNNVLGRAPDAGGRAYWIEELGKGTSRGAMMIGFSESSEYRARSYHPVQVTMMYMSMLRRPPEQDGFDHWVGELDGGASILGLIESFINSSEYANRFIVPAQGTVAPLNQLASAMDELQPRTSAASTSLVLPLTLEKPNQPAWPIEEQDWWSAVLEDTHSTDGGDVVFVTDASLLDEDTNLHSDIYHYDEANGQLRLLSRAMNGTAGNAPSHSAQLYADGRQVLFLSRATNLTLNRLADVSHNDTQHLFAVDLDNGLIRRLSETARGEAANDDISAFDLAPAVGRLVLRAHATNFDAGPGLYLLDLETGFSQSLVSRPWFDKTDPQAERPALDASATLLAWDQPDASGQRQIHTLNLTTLANRQETPIDAFAVESCCVLISENGRYLAWREKNLDGTLWLRILDDLSGEHRSLQWPEEVNTEADSVRVEFIEDGAVMQWRTLGTPIDHAAVLHRELNPVFIEDKAMDESSAQKNARNF